MGTARESHLPCGSVRAQFGAGAGPVTERFRRAARFPLVLSLLTGPALALLIVIPLFLLAAVRKGVRLARRPGRAGHAYGSRGVGATATEELHALIYPSKRVQLVQRRIELVLRDDERDGAPERTGIDLAAGTARIGTERPYRR
ncbi:DUF6191 domain-containing protein [Streptomyces sp. NPDC050610]|uniref:DUF6191 domain-containing protein n=1 Tax=Streptomyces sp. NPDC050610 TaxID=3157097 RepID=UPI0034213B87